LSVYPKVMILF